MTQLEQMVENIREIVGGRRGVKTFPVMLGKVVAGSYNSADMTVSVLLSCDDDVATEDIVNNVVVSNDLGLTMIPADNSFVLVAEVDGSGKFGVIKCSELASLTVKVGDKSLLINGDGVVMNGGSLGGLVKIEALVSRLNGLESLLNDLISKFNAHVHSGVQTGGGVSGITTSLEGGSASVTNRSDLENTNVTQ